MSASILFTAALLGVAQAYTVISAPGPFMLKNIDSIVFPGQYDKSHLHCFFGSDAVTVNTKTSAELQKGCTNLENPNDLAYYNLGEAPAEVAIPQNLKMVAGDAQAKTKAQLPAESKAEWFCEGGGGGALDANGFPSATCGTHLQQLLYFPSCGMKSMPQLRFSIRYNLRKVLPNGWSGAAAPFKLSCGPASCVPNRLQVIFFVSYFGCVYL
ncbi:hypothetical protein VD0004_g9060 [Verticillium dahliae]|uniref:DUF1996 domain-containing protein n=1 Tax=Verticillium dahliae TaxID=27337 RepID=A0AA45ANT1_VERDA|nr:hypothetical protein BJF96_g2665 [Verticillium dahliae]PNH37736.1 hypothetical protein VD0004_g9060 [Verticillium dahliae]